MFYLLNQLVVFFSKWNIGVSKWNTVFSDLALSYTGRGLQAVPLWFLQTDTAWKRVYWLSVRFFPAFQLFFSSQ